MTPPREIASYSLGTPMAVIICDQGWQINTRQQRQAVYKDKIYCSQMVKMIWNCASLGKLFMTDVEGSCETIKWFIKQTRETGLFAVGKIS